MDADGGFDPELGQFALQGGDALIARNDEQPETWKDVIADRDELRAQNEHLWNIIERQKAIIQDLKSRLNISATASPVALSPSMTLQSAPVLVAGDLHGLDVHASDPLAHPALKSPPRSKLPDTPPTTTPTTPQTQSPELIYNDGVTASLEPSQQPFVKSSTLTISPVSVSAGYEEKPRSVEGSEKKLKAEDGVSAADTSDSADTRQKLTAIPPLEMGSNLDAVKSEIMDSILMNFGDDIRVPSLDDSLALITSLKPISSIEVPDSLSQDEDPDGGDDEEVVEIDGGNVKEAEIDQETRLEATVIADIIKSDADASIGSDGSNGEVKPRKRVIVVARNGERELPGGDGGDANASDDDDEEKMFSPSRAVRRREAQRRRAKEQSEVSAKESDASAPNKPQSPVVAEAGINTSVSTATYASYVPSTQRTSSLMSKQQHQDAPLGNRESIRSSIASASFESSAPIDERYRKLSVDDYIAPTVQPPIKARSSSVTDAKATDSTGIHSTHHILPPTDPLLPLPALSPSPPPVPYRGPADLNMKSSPQLPPRPMMPLPIQNMGGLSMLQRSASAGYSMPYASQPQAPLQAISNSSLVAKTSSSTLSQSEGSNSQTGSSSSINSTQFGSTANVSIASNSQDSIGARSSEIDSESFGVMIASEVKHDWPSTTLAQASKHAFSSLPVQYRSMSPPIATRPPFLRGIVSNKGLPPVPNSPVTPIISPALTSTAGVQIQVISSSILSTGADKGAKEVVSFIISVKGGQCGEAGWKIEKVFSDVFTLDSKLRSLLSRQQLSKIGKPPDKSLFTSFNPARSDQRKVALELYIQRLLEVVVDSKDVIDFISSNIVMSSLERTRSSDSNLEQQPQQPVNTGVLKEGFLVKKGKSFGGWKTRFFKCRPGVVEYYDATGRELLGSIRLKNCNIIRNAVERGSISSGADARSHHSFTLVEYKTGTFSSVPHTVGVEQIPHESKVFAKHTLCAESDEERDEWVKVIAQQITLARPSAKIDIAVLLSPAPLGLTILGYDSSRDSPELTSATSSSSGPVSPMPTGQQFQYFPLMRGVGGRKVSADSLTNNSNSGSNFGITLTTPSQSQPSSAPTPSQIQAAALQILGNTAPSGRAPLPMMQHPALLGTIDEKMKGGVDDMARIMQQDVPLLVADDPNRRGASYGAVMPPALKGPTGGVAANLAGSTSKRITTAFSSWAKKKGPDLASSAPGRLGGGSTGSASAAVDPSRLVFGVSLEQAIAVSRVNDAYELPAVIYRCIEYLDAVRAWEEEGLYRLSGLASVIQLLKERFNVEKDFDILGSPERLDVHAVAGLLKLFLRELQNHTPILTKHLHPQFLRLADISDRDDRITELSRLVSLLPVANYTLLRVLMAHLIRVVQYSDVNKMTVRNVCIVFSPTLGIPVVILTMMMAEYEWVFCWEDPARAAIMRDRERAVAERAIADRDEGLRRQREFEDEVEKSERERELGQGVSWDADTRSEPVVASGGEAVAEDENELRIAAKKARREKARGSLAGGLLASPELGEQVRRSLNMGNSASWTSNQAGENAVGVVPGDEDSSGVEDSTTAAITAEYEDNVDSYSKYQSKGQDRDQDEEVDDYMLDIYTDAGRNNNQAPSSNAIENSRSTTPESNAWTVTATAPSIELSSAQASPGVDFDEEEVVVDDDEDEGRDGDANGYFNMIGGGSGDD